MAMTFICNAIAGWGLDFAWPFLLRYPKRHIAVIDDVCMTHSAPSGQKSGEGNLYSVPVPYGEREEETRRNAEYHYFPSRVQAMGLPYRPMIEVGIVMKTLNRSEDVLDVHHQRLPLPNRLPRYITPNRSLIMQLLGRSDSGDGMVNQSPQLDLMPQRLVVLCAFALFLIGFVRIKNRSPLFQSILRRGGRSFKS